jgi:hypothetical protein
VLLVAAYAIGYALLGPHLRINEGLGWDGMLYANVARGTQADVSGYLAERMLPSILVKYAAQALRVDLGNPAALIRIFRAMNAIAFTAAAGLWVLIARERR